MPLTAKDLAGPDPNPMTHAEVDALKQICLALPANPRIIQIGAERGCSTLAILEARPDSFVFSIDVGAREEEIANVKAANLDSRRVVRGLGRSQSIGHFWPESWKADLIYIDGDHRYAGIREDIAVWIPAVASGGILAFHDFIPPEERASQIIGRVYEALADAGLLEHLLYQSSHCEAMILGKRGSKVLQAFLDFGQG